MTSVEVHGLQHIQAFAHKETSVAYIWTDILRPASETHKCVWLFFVNGLGLSQVAWQPTLKLLQADSYLSSFLGTSIVASTFDRYGQGLSQPPDNRQPQSHDCHEAAQEIQYMINRLRLKHLSDLAHGELSIVIISHSIGVPLTRLAFDTSRGYVPDPAPPVRGYIFLDSNMANVDLAELLPSLDVDPTNLPVDTSLEDLLKARMFYKKLFSLDAPNAENLSRVSMGPAVPAADAPVLPAWQYTRNAKHAEDLVTNVKPLLRIVEHDPEAFAEESLKICTKGLTMEYVNPAWHEYNLGLSRLDGEGAGSKITVANGAGHFVQRDNPKCVANQIINIVATIC